MYNCKLCGKTVPAHTPAIRVVLATRPVVYPSRAISKRVGTRKYRFWIDKGGKGREIVREELVCGECAAYSSR